MFRPSRSTTSLASSSERPCAASSRWPVSKWQPLGEDKSQRDLPPLASPGGESSAEDQREEGRAMGREAVHGAAALRGPRPPPQQRQRQRRREERGCSPLAGARGRPCSAHARRQEGERSKNARARTRRATPHHCEAVRITAGVRPPPPAYAHPNRCNREANRNRRGGACPGGWKSMKAQSCWLSRRVAAFTATASHRAQQVAAALTTTIGAALLSRSSAAAHVARGPSFALPDRSPWRPVP